LCQITRIQNKEVDRSEGEGRSRIALIKKADLFLLVVDMTRDYEDKNAQKENEANLRHQYVGFGNIVDDNHRHIGLRECLTRAVSTLQPIARRLSQAVNTTARKVLTRLLIIYRKNIDE